MCLTSRARGAFFGLHSITTGRHRPIRGASMTQTLKHLARSRRPAAGGAAQAACGRLHGRQFVPPRSRASIHSVNRALDASRDHRRSRRRDDPCPGGESHRAEPPRPATICWRAVANRLRHQGSGPRATRWAPESCILSQRLPVSRPAAARPSRSTASISRPGRPCISRHSGRRSS